MFRSAWHWVLAGAVLRLLWPSDFLFRQDEAEHLEHSFRISQGREWVRHAWPSSVGLENGPVFAYFLAASTAVSADPRVAQLSIVAANLIALGFAALLFRRLLPTASEARLATALYASSPLAIWFSRKIWDPCLLALFCVPALFALTRALQEKRSRAIAFVPPLVALALQVHQSGVFFALLVAGVTLLRWRSLAKGWLLAGAAIAAILLAPYLSFLLPRVFSGGLALSSRSRFPDVDVITNLFLDVSGHNILQTAGHAAGRMLLWPVPPAWLLVQLAGLPFYLHAFSGYRDLLRRPSGGAEGSSAGTAESVASETRAILVGLCVGLPLLYLIFRVRGVPHYFLPILPLLFVVVVLGARRSAGRRTGWRGVLLSLPFLVIVNVLSWIGFQSYMSFHRGSPSYGLPYSNLVDACGDVADLARAPLPDVGRVQDVEAPDAGEKAIALFVDVPRDRGPLPAQYAYVLCRLEGLQVVPARAEDDADIVLRVQWSSENGRAGYSAALGRARQGPRAEPTASRASGP
jgi:4-amino-4-deoxy-L-arabinose transferase-like glycosyltransferase